MELRTERLVLRRWEDADRAPFAALNADPVVMEFFPAPLTLGESDALIDRIEHHFETAGFGLWAVEEQATESFAGFVGLSSATFEAHFTPAVEVGWRLDRRFWGRGIATEAANAALNDGFGRLGLAEIVSFTATVNTPSRRVMSRLGMTHDPADDFDHPSVAVDSLLRRHVLCRLSTVGWRDRV